MNKVRHSDGSAGDVDYGEIGKSYGRFRQPEPVIDLRAESVFDGLFTADCR